MRPLLEEFQRIGELRVISGANVEEEIGALTELNAKQDRPFALLFDDIPGYPAGHRVVTGIVDSPRRLGLALGLETTTTAELIGHLRGSVRGWIQRSGEYAPREMSAAETGLRRVRCGEDGIDVTSFPAPLWHPGDGGRYIGTGCAVLTRGPDDDWVNAGAYRVMVTGPDQVAIYMATSRQGRAHMEAWWDRGEPAPVAVVAGGHPLLAMLAGVEIPAGVSELAVMGAALGSPVDVTLSHNTGLPIPADAELVLEGFVHPGTTEVEGPFGEATGYYAGGAHHAPVLRVDRIWMRENPIILGASPGKPPHDFGYPFSVMRSALLHDAIEAAGVTEVRGVWTSYARQWIVVAVRQSHPGHARQAAYIAAHCGPGGYLARYIIAVDDDIDPTDTAEVLWAITTRADPATDIDVMRKTWGSPIDPMGVLFDEGRSYNSRAVIDASIPYTRRDVFPMVVASAPERLAAVAARWQSVFADAGSDQFSERSTESTTPEAEGTSG